MLTVLIALALVPFAIYGAVFAFALVRTFIKPILITATASAAAVGALLTVLFANSFPKYSTADTTVTLSVTLLLAWATYSLISTKKPEKALMQ